MCRRSSARATGSPLVGRNGAGKTTLLRMLGGELQPDRGEHRCRPGTRMALPTSPPARRNRRARVVVGAEPPRREEAGGGAARLEDAVRRAPDRRRYLRRYDAAQREFERPAATHGAPARGGARGLGFSADLDRHAAAFSGGELTRHRWCAPLAAGGRRAAPRRADQPPRYRTPIEWLKGTWPGSTPGGVRVARPLVPRVGRRPACSRSTAGRDVTKGSYSNWRRVKAERVAAQAGAFERQQEELAAPPAVRRPVPVRDEGPPGAERARRR